MTTQETELLKKALEPLLADQVQEDELIPEFKRYTATLREEIAKDIMKGHFEIDAATGELFAIEPPAKEDTANDLQAFLRKNKISVQKPERRSLSQLIDEQKKSWRVFK